MRQALTKTLFGSLVLALGLPVAVSAVRAQEAPAPVKSILIVDRGNIQRSVVAELILRRLLERQGLAGRYEVFSRGMQGTPASPEVPAHHNLKYFNASTSPGREWEHSLPTLRELGLVEALEQHRSTVLSRKDLERAVLVLAMDTPTMSDPTWGISVQFPGFANKVILFTELVGSGAGIADGHGASDSDRHRQLILDIDRVLRAGFDGLIARVEGASSLPR